MEHRLARPVAVPLLLVVTFALGATHPLAAQTATDVPTVLTYQGRLLENTTGAGPVTGSVDIVFSIWSDLTDGTELWSESWSNVQLSSGVFSVLLGSNGSPLDPAEFQNDPTLFVQLEIDGETLSPRQQLGSVPFAIVDERKNELQDLTFDGTNLGLTQSGVTVDLASSDNQDLSLSGNTLSLENDPTPVDLSSYLDNTDDQQLGLAGETLSLTNGGSVDLSTVLQNKLIVFVTSVGHDGNFGGLAGADAFCQSLADAVSLGGTFKAWLSDSTTSPADRFAHRSESYVRVDGVQVADNWDDLTDGSLDARIDVDEMGNSVGRQLVWTNTRPSGAVYGTTANDNCADWTSATGVGQLGITNTTTGSWTQGGNGSCARILRLDCFEQSVTLADLLRRIEALEALHR